MLPFKTSFIHYTVQGDGQPVILLHGYLESIEIWRDFAPELAKRFMVICIDIPGHGKSGKVAEVHTMELMAEGVETVIQHLHIEKSFIIGHSMGGYVAMAYLAQYRRKVSGLCLFHSTPFADSVEKQSNRDREIEIIRQGRQNIIFTLNPARGFANNNLEKLKETVVWANSIAAQTSPEGMIALLEGMKIRPDRQNMLKECNTPMLSILGKKDNFIPFELANMVAQRPPKSEVLALETSGHNGFLEEPKLCLESLKSFIDQYCFFIAK